MDLPLNAAQQRIRRAALALFAERGVTQLNISELAQAAGVTRGTIYNNLQQPDSLFQDVAAALAAEMNERVTRSFAGIDDPAVRMANGIRHYVRRAHEEPDWGRFLIRFAFSNMALQEMWNGPPVRDIMQGCEQGRFLCRPEQLAPVVALLAGSVLGAIFLVLDGVKTWREAGSEMAELVLIALGVARDEAGAIARLALPALPPAG